MKQQELINAVMKEAQDAGVFLQKKTITTVVEAMSRVILLEAGAGREVRIPMVGKLKPKLLAPRTGVNPSTGEPITIAAKYRVKFLASSELTRALADSQ